MEKNKYGNYILLDLEKIEVNKLADAAETAPSS